MVVAAHAWGRAAKMAAAAAATVAAAETIGELRVEVNGQSQVGVGSGAGSGWINFDVTLQVEHDGGQNFVQIRVLAKNGLAGMNGVKADVTIAELRGYRCCKCKDNRSRGTDACVES